MSGINFHRTYTLGAGYDGVVERTVRKLAKYHYFPQLVRFNDQERTVTFTTERLIPAASTNRTRVMLLFSNPHPYSIYQGMFLSPNTQGQVNLFWPVMDGAGWLSVENIPDSPKELGDICISADYQSPFELVFYCYYAFPTDYPEDIQRIFGRNYFAEVIAPEAKDEFIRTVQETRAEAVVTFNKGIFNLAAQAPVERYIKRLNAGELIHSQVTGLERDIPIYLTYPTGWRYHRQYMDLRVAHLERIRMAICSRGG